MKRYFNCSPFEPNSSIFLQKILMIHTTTTSQALNPWFITGFADGEGCFNLSVLRAKDYELGWRVQLFFKITLHSKDLPILEQIKSYLGVGGIHKQGPQSIQFRVFSVKDLQVIVQHFEKFPLISQKRADFELFKQALRLMEEKEHLTEGGLAKFVAIKDSMNNGLSDELKAAFPKIIPVPRPLVEDQEIKDPNWLAGFISGEGCFFIDIYNSKTNKLGSSVRLKFIISQHIRDINLMESLVNYLGCGRYVLAPLGYNHGEYIVSKLSDINEKIIPFLQKYPILGNKFWDFEDFCKASFIMKNKEHLTIEGLKKIQILKSGMNRGRIN